MDRLFLTFGIIASSLGCGYACRRLAMQTKKDNWATRLGSLRHRMQSFAVFVLLPFSAMLSLWGLPAPTAILLALPLLGLVSWILGGLFAVTFSAALGLGRLQTGSMYCCGTFANIGAVGSLVCVIFLGENSIALVALYRLCEELFYYSIAFPIARWYAHPAQTPFPTFKSVGFDPLLRTIILALLLGIAMNLLGIERPRICSCLAGAATIAATVLFLLSIGLTLRLSRLSAYVPQSLAICTIKFICMPAIMASLAILTGFGQVEQGLPLKVVVILSSMPVAMTALVPPGIFSLDVDLANSCWIFSTAGLLVVLPVLLLIIRYV